SVDSRPSTNPCIVDTSRHGIQGRVYLILPPPAQDLQSGKRAVPLADRLGSREGQPFFSACEASSIARSAARALLARSSRPCAHCRKVCSASVRTPSSSS